MFDTVSFSSWSLSYCACYHFFFFIISFFVLYLCLFDIVNFSSCHFSFLFKYLWYFFLLRLSVLCCSSIVLLTVSSCSQSYLHHNIPSFLHFFPEVVVRTKLTLQRTLNTTALSDETKYVNRAHTNFQIKLIRTRATCCTTLLKMEFFVGKFTHLGRQRRVGDVQGENLDDQFLKLVLINTKK